jgi:hypothetical protein
MKSKVGWGEMELGWAGGRLRFRGGLGPKGKEREGERIGLAEGLGFLFCFILKLF